MDWNEIGGFIPSDHARQVTSRYYIEQLMAGERPPRTVIDLGCGTGASLYDFRAHDPQVAWIGVDVGDSREAAARPTLPAAVVIYDGVRLPFAAGSVDLVYSHQAFEHVQYPRELLAEVARILAPGGRFAGSTSQLEPYHSRSFWNYTVPGFCELLLDAGFAVDEVRPGIDGPTLIERAMSDDQSAFNGFFEQESPVNQQIDQWARERGRGPGATNHRKLRFCGQFAFLAHRSGQPPAPETGPPRRAAAPRSLRTTTRRQLGRAARKLGLRR